MKAAGYAVFPFVLVRVYPCFGAPATGGQPLPLGGPVLHG